MLKPRRPHVYVGDAMYVLLRDELGWKEAGEPPPERHRASIDRKVEAAARKRVWGVSIALLVCGVVLLFTPVGTGSQGGRGEARLVRFAVIIVAAGALAATRNPLTVDVEPACDRCGYDLTGLADEARVCPECGAGLSVRPTPGLWFAQRRACGSPCGRAGPAPLPCPVRSHSRA